MKVSPVSFGQVVAVCGKNKKIQHLRCEMATVSQVACVDATDYFKKTYSNGVLGQAVRDNQMVDFYITGEDYDSYMQKKPEWKTLNDIACQLDKYYDLKKTSTNTVKALLKESI